MREDVAWRHELRQLAEPTAPGRIREFVSRHLRHHHLSHLVEPVRLVASELATNAIVHGGTEVLVTLFREDATVVLTVEDDRPHVWPTLELAPATAESGPGLWLVEILSEDWGVRTERRGSKAVWASFDTTPADPSVPACTCRASHPSARRVSAPVLRLVRPEG